MKKQEFDHLIQKWNDDTWMYSSISSIIDHPSYKMLANCEFGTQKQDVLKLLLERLISGDFNVGFFCLLFQITGVDPVNPDDAGDVPAMTKAWIDWGKAQNLIL